MHVIMGGTGHVGSAAADVLLRRGQAVTIVTRDAGSAREWRAKGASIAEAAVEDVAALRAAFQLGRRAFLLNPPAAVTTDTDVVERRTIACILAALEGSGLEKVVAASTSGAQPGDRIGDLSTLWELEEGLRRQSIPAAVNRGAYYLSNWDGQLNTIRTTGQLSTLFDIDQAIPMVSPRDLGKAAADRLMSGVDDTRVRHVEGPRSYSSRDVADSFSLALGRPVTVEVTPRESWNEAFLALGFSAAAARSYTRMTEVAVDEGFDGADDPIRGVTTLDEHVHGLVAGSAG